MFLTEAPRTILLAALATLGMIAWMSTRALRLASPSPERLVAELRLAQVGALVLAFTGGAYVGLAAMHDAPGAGLDVAFALGFLVVAILAPLRDPHEALLALALAFAAHAGLDVLHRPGYLADGLAPPWYVVGCAVHNVLAGSLCYAPLIRR